MMRETLRDERVRALDHRSSEPLQAVYEWIDTVKEPTAQAAPNQEAVQDVRDALSDGSEPLSRTIEKEREENRL
ncbi:hypothetical protein [Salinibacter sp.]|uniref:hypothetical protein n=1 Tax=Salinibacter sp. TaxID=2065818 RepID=UPI0021E6F815|nr:hypothetical protein [Salinibacter sp.]